MTRRRAVRTTLDVVVAVAVVAGLIWVQTIVDWLTGKL